MARPRKEHIVKWCKALRSGKFNQGKGALQTVEGYCCLGVACKIFIPKTKQIDMLEGYVPSEQKHAPNWLKYVNGIFGVRTTRTLVALNDDFDFTFDEIADVLEAVYILEVLP